MNLPIIDPIYKNMFFYDTTRICIDNKNISVSELISNLPSAKKYYI